MIRTLGAQPVLCSPFGGETGALARDLARGEGLGVAGIEAGGANGSYIDDRRGGERTVLLEIPAAVLNRHELDDLYALTIETAMASGVCVITGTHADRIIPDETSAGSARTCRRTASRSSPTCREHRSRR
jgi:1-phosphofructokinase